MAESTYDTQGSAWRAGFLSMYIACLLSLLFSLVGLIEIIFSGKLRFQRYRLVALLMGIQLFGAILLIINQQVEISPKYSTIMFKCGGSGGMFWNLTEGLGEGLLLGAVTTEIIMAAFGGFSLFYAKREVARVTERICYVIPIAVSIIAGSWCVSVNSRMHQSYCTNNTALGTRVYTLKADFWVFACVVAALLILAYILLLLIRRSQGRTWEEMRVILMKEKHRIPPAELDVKVKLLETHMATVQEVLGFYWLFFLLSIFGISGIIVCYWGNRYFEQSSKLYYGETLWFFGRALISMQAFLQACSYFYIDHKADKLSSVSRILAGLRPTPGVQFSDQLHELLMND
eukprot:m.111376 g.111376  ORF g.111376 m.111376 type:complete len:345 (-) comp14059_c0_seq2:205-1239(-)